jgi:hypothetical protein
MATRLGDRDWEILLRRIHDGKCTPFLGAGINHGVLPLGSEIARVSRGLARALTGDYAGAIEDFKLGVEWLRNSALLKPLVSEWQAWLTALEAGRNPFDSATLEALRLREMWQ